MGFVVLGVGMMLVTLVISALVPEQSSGLQLTNRAFMAVGGGLAAGGILGYLNVDLRVWKRGMIRGGGGFGLFLVLYLLNPPLEMAYAFVPEDRKDLVAELRRSELIGPSRGDLDSVLRAHGFGSEREFAVTATKADIRKIQRDIRMPG